MFYIKQMKKLDRKIEKQLHFWKILMEFTAPGSGSRSANLYWILILGSKSTSLLVSCINGSKSLFPCFSDVYEEDLCEDYDPKDQEEGDEQVEADLP